MSSGSATGNTKASSLLKQNSSNAMMSLRVFCFLFLLICFFLSIFISFIIINKSFKLINCFFFYMIDHDKASTVMDATVMQYRDAIGYMVARQPFVETVSQLLKVAFF